MGSDSSVNKLTKETWEDNPGVDLSHSSPRPSCLEASEFKDGDGLEIHDQRLLSSSKRKRNVADGDSDSPVNASKDVCTLTADAVSSLPSGSTEDVSVEMCGACFKRQRYCYSQ